MQCVPGRGENGRPGQKFDGQDVINTTRKRARAFAELGCCVGSGLGT